tara:strand:- start:1709 stop:1876 length:168 start_codon:yes stop_codon:yes gene_type:complete
MAGVRLRDNYSLVDGVTAGEAFVEYRHSWDNMHLFAEAAANTGEWSAEAGLKWEW